MSTVSKIITSFALLVLGSVAAPMARATIIIGAPQSIDADTFKLAVSLVGESFPTIDSLQVLVNYDALPLSLVSVDIHPDSPYAPAHLPSNLSISKNVAVPEDVSFGVIDKLSQSNPFNPGPLLQLVFNRTAPTTGPELVTTSVRFQYVDLSTEEEFDLMREASVNVSAIPEPGAALLLTVGLALVGLVGMRRNRGS